MVLVTNEMCHEGFLITIDPTITLHTQECLVFQPPTFTKQPFIPFERKWLKDTPPSAMKQISRF